MLCIFKLVETLKKNHNIEDILDCYKLKDNLLDCKI